jgi:hypothetical protein
VAEMALNPDKTYSAWELYEYDVLINANVGFYSIMIIVLGVLYNDVAKNYAETLNIQY